MNFDFTDLSSAVLSAYNAYQMKKDIVSKKESLLKNIIASKNINPDTILFLGFDPWILGDYGDTEIFVGLISNEVADFLDNSGIKYTRIYNNELYTTIPHDVVVGADELLTYCSDQRGTVELVAELTNELFITTLRDYKNLNIRDRDFSNPTAIKNENGYSVFLEFHNYEYNVKNKWVSYIYENGSNNRIYGPFNRQPMYFKQLATFGYEAGAAKFKVQKDVMFKSLLKKNYEHVMTLSF